MNSSFDNPVQKPSRFALLRHVVPPNGLNGRGDHFDLMLEREHGLKTWALDRIPDVGEIVTATALADHRKVYLDYEGPISKGRGSVKREWAGNYIVLESSDSSLLIRLVETEREMDLRFNFTKQSTTITRVPATNES